MDTYQLLRRSAYGIVDSLAVESIPDGLSRPVALVPAWLRGQDGQLPGLVRLATLTMEQIGLLTDCMDREVAANEMPSIATFIATEADEPTIRSHMVSRMTLYQAGRRALLRFSDPRVMLQLSWMLSSEELAWLFGPVDKYFVWVPGGWHGIERPMAVSATRPPSDWSALRRIGLINEVLVEVRHSDDYRALVIVSQCIDQALQRAERYGLLEEEDQIAFAKHAVTIHPDFDLHPTITRLIAALDIETCYRDSVSLLGDDEWCRIRTEINSRTGTRKVT